MEHSSVMRAEWFARLADAIEGAQQVAWQLRTYKSASVEARELYGRLEEARLELQALKEADSLPSPRSDPAWLNRLGWIGALDEPNR